MNKKSTLSCILFALSINISISASEQAVNIQDSLALVDLYNSTNGLGWKKHDNWLTGPVSTWYGITLENNRVIKIDLYKNRLQGKIEPSIGELDSLLDLDLSLNNLTSIPPEIGNLANLMNLSLPGNQLTSIPPEIGNLVNLENLNLVENKLTSIPPEIGDLANLSVLGLSGNRLASIPPEIGNLVNLSGLTLSLNQLTSIPAEIGNLVNLEYLTLAENQLTSIPAEIGNLVNLSTLYLYVNHLTHVPPEIGNLTSLVELLLFDNQLTSIPHEIGNLASLYVLDLVSNQLTNIPPEIGNLVNLSVLNLQLNQLTGIPPEIGNLLNLQYFGFNNNQLTSIPPEIGNLANLQYFFVYNNHLTSIPPEIGNLVKLTQLILSSNNITSIPPEIGNLVNLENLSLEENQLTSIPVEIGNLVSLSTLWSRSNQLTSIPAEIGNLTNLEQLDVSSNNLTSIPPEIAYLANRGYLYLYNNRITFDALELFAQYPYCIYSPQANIPLHQNGNTLSTTAGGTLSKNTYNWFKVGESGNTTIAGDSLFYPPSSGQYYAAVTNSICTQLTLYTDTVYIDPVMPVTLINLTAQQQGGMVTIGWTSVTEINVDHYEIQRSADAQNFTGIGNVPAKGNGTESINYAYNDKKPVQGNNYYKLKAIDKDGAVTFSNIALVNLHSAITKVYPNPAKDILNLQCNGSISFSLINQAGKTVYAATINNSGIINVSGLAGGMYYLKNNSTGAVQKVVIGQ